MGDRYICPSCSSLLCGEGGVTWFCDEPCPNCHNPDCVEFKLPQHIPSAWREKAEMPNGLVWHLIITKGIGAPLAINQVKNSIESFLKK